MGLRLAAALTGFWFIRGSWQEGRRWLQTAVGRSAALGRTGARARALMGLGRLIVHQDDMVAARPMLEESLSIGREIGDSATISLSLLNLAKLARDQGDFATGRSLAAESLTLCRQVGDRACLASSLTVMGGTELRLGNLDAARALFEESLEVAREGGLVLGWPIVSLGQIAQLQGDEERAVRLFEEALALNARGIHKVCIAGALEGLAEVAVTLGELERAVRLYGAAASVREAIGAPEAHECRLSLIRPALGEEAFAAAWASGREMTLQEAIRVALAENEMPTRKAPRGNPGGMAPKVRTTTPHR